MISKKMSHHLSHASWIRVMFEEGEKLRRQFGGDKVFDFTLGNPDAEPPREAKESLKKWVSEDPPGLHRYMTNSGFADVRAKIAHYASAETGTHLTQDEIVMTCGAAGAMNVVLKTVLNPDDEVVIFSPYFVEYLFYVDNHGGRVVIVPTSAESFEPDVEAFRKALTPRCKAVILNSPNNPTGAVYGEETLRQMAVVLEEHEAETGNPVLVVSDEPYKRLVYDGLSTPSVLAIFKNSAVATSFSKSLALPGERIGYIAASPRMEGLKQFVDGLIFANRTLGFVNAPALFQKVAGDAVGAAVDAEPYRKRRDILYDHLAGLGISCVKPRGAFYLFPRSPIPDDVAFVRQALAHQILLVPGSGFGCPGHFRLSYCVGMKTIENALPAFDRLMGEFAGPLRHREVAL